MRIFKFILSLTITLGLIYVLDHRWVIKDNAIPPLGKFLDPFHGFWQNVKPSDERLAEEIEIPGLKGEVKIVFDSLMIPHIYAENEEDLFLAQGYVTASHRLWQMEFQTFAAAGRLSEIVPTDRLLEYDRKQRRLGMVLGAKKAFEAHLQDPIMKMAATRYTEGVNAYIASLDYADLPFEYKLLDYAPSNWEPVNMAFFLKNLSQTLNMSNVDVEMTNALALFGKEMVDYLYAENIQGFGEPVIDNPGGWNFTPVTLDTVPLAIPQQYVTIPVDKKKPRGIGSNNWAIHGSRTATGAPLLANDPHLSLTLPSIWYTVHLNAPGVNTMGVSVPGAPSVVIGFNDSIAWGVTNAERDLVDWYAIKFKDKNYNEYLSDGQWKKTTKVVEEFRIRGKEPFYDTVVYTHHGPVVYDKNFHGDSDKNHYAFRWIAHDPSQELVALYKLNRAKNHNDFREALKYLNAPAQNFVFASVSGDIAMQIQGKFPVRRKNEGRFVLDGTNTDSEWKSFIPYEHNIQQKNPPRGFVSSANQFPVDATYPYFVNAPNYELYRNRRINELLGKMTNVKPKDLIAMHTDNYNLQAAESLPLMLSLLNVSSLKGEESRIAEALTFWDYVNSPESLAASYYELWWLNFKRLVFDELTGAKVDLVLPSDHALIRIMKQDSAFVMFDVQSTTKKESMRELIRQSFTDAAVQIGEWENEKQKSIQWADYKNTEIRHLLRIPQLSIKVRNGGGGNSINATTTEAGPSVRHVISLEKNGVKAWSVYPGGQSGNAGSRFYSNMIDAWQKGEAYRMIFTSKYEDAARQAYSITTLKPE